MLRQCFTNFLLDVWLQGQIPVALGVTGFQALCLYRTSQIASQTNSEVDLDYTLTDLNWGVGKLVIYAGSAVGTGTMGGLLGVGGGTIIGPFLLELGLPPEVLRTHDPCLT